MKLLVVLVVAMLLALLLVNGNVHPGLGLGLVVLVVLVFACLAAALQYAEMRNRHIEKQMRYSRRTEEQLKKALREVVTELKEEKTGQTPLTVRLIEIINARFNAEELRSLCADLHAMYPDRLCDPSLDYDSLVGQGKAAKARELVLYCQRRGMLDELASAIRDRRPDSKGESG
jgi:hypothetical protein